MHVILDTNIVYNNWYFDTPKFKALFEYLDKTRSDLIIPKLVEQEILKKYTEEVEKYFNTKIKKESILFRGVPMAEKDSVLSNYRMFLEDFLSKHRVLDYSDIDISVIMSRCLDQLPPFKKRGDGFRDTVIWETILDLLKSDQEGENYFAFISSNKLDFGDGCLHENLSTDLDEASSNIEYFNSLEDFLSKYGEAIRFIDNDFFDKYLHSISPEKYTLLVSKDMIADTVGRMNSGGGCSEADIDCLEFDSVKIANYYLYNSTEEHYYVNLNILLYLATTTMNYAAYQVLGTMYFESYNIESDISLRLKIGKKNREIHLTGVEVNDCSAFHLD